MHTPTVVLRVAVFGAAALVLTACSGGGATSSAPSSVPTSASPAGASGSGSAGSGGPSLVQAQSAAQGTSSVPACATGQLKASQANASVGAGQYYAQLVLTNISGTTCTLTGFPGVSYVTAGGVQSGNPAQRTGGPARTVTLRPHASAAAALHDSNGISGYDPKQCDLTSVEGLRVYPPNQKAALFVPWKTQHCAGTSIHPLTIGPVQR